MVELPRPCAFIVFIEEMRRWDNKETEIAVKKAIRQAGPEGGFILSDNHGEIPWQVPDSVLHEISESVQQWGSYQLKWILGNG